MRCTAVFLLATIFLSCSGKDDATKLQQSIVSWRATLLMVADARLREEVGKGYAKNTIDEAVEDLTALAAKPSLPHSLTAEAQRVIGIAGSLRGGVESADRNVIEKARVDLASTSSRR